MSTLFDGPRRIRAEELEGARALSQLCFQSVLPDDVGPPSAPPREAGETYIVAAEGRPVSQVRAFHERLLAYDGLVRVGSIGAVCTHPDYRGHGLATQLMDLCTRRLYEGGARLMLISGGRGLYRRLGFIPGGGLRLLYLAPRAGRRLYSPRAAPARDAGERRGRRRGLRRAVRRRAGALSAQPWSTPSTTCATTPTAITASAGSWSGRGSPRPICC